MNEQALQEMANNKLLEFVDFTFGLIGLLCLLCLIVYLTFEFLTQGEKS
jgi:hypothetical protein